MSETATLTREEHQARVDEVLACEERRRRAILDHDLTALAEVLSEELRYVHSNGVIDTKDEFLSLVGAWTFESYEHSEQEVRLDGGLAVITALTAITVSQGETVMSGKIRTMNVWERSASGWKQVLWQAGKAGPEE